MRTTLTFLAALSVAVGGCGRSETVVTPLAEVGDDFWGDLRLADGGRLHVMSGRRLGDWVCADPSGAGRGDLCVRAAQVSGVARSERVAGPGDAVGLAVSAVVVLPTAAVWAFFQDKQNKDARASGPPPPPLSPEELARREALRGLVNCLDVAGDDGDRLDGDLLAGEVWRDRDQCLDAAAAWYGATGDLDRARSLTLVHLARRRYEALACGEDDPGLTAPDPEVIGDAGSRWMGEYRGVVADSRTYAYEITRRCPSMAEDDMRRPPTREAQSVARTQVVGTFPLTDPQRLATALAWKT